MATTTVLYATTATQTAGTWTNPTNATGAPNATGTTAPTNCATWVNAARSTTATLELSGYNFQSQIGANDTITAVTLTLPHAETSTTNISGLTATLFSGATAIGAAQTVTRVTTLTTHTINFPTMPTYAQLADLRVQITSSRANNTTSSTEYIDAAGLQVTYTPLVVPTTAPTLTAGTLTHNAVPLSWTAITGATSYDIERAGVVTYTGLTGLVKVDIDRAASTAYAYRVRAVNAAGAGPWSTTVNATTLATPSGDPVMGVPGLYRRFKASTITGVANGGTVTSWTDQIGGVTTTLPAGGVAPTFITSALNGKPAVNFSGTASTQKLQLPDGAFNYNLDEVTLVAVMKVNSWTTSATHGTVFGQGDNSWAIKRTAANNQIEMVAAITGSTWTEVSIPTTVDFTLPHVIIGTVAISGPSTIYLDGGTGTSAANSLTASGINKETVNPSIGDNIDFPGRYLDHQIYELMLFFHPLTAAQRATVDTYVQNTYGITVADYVATPSTYKKSQFLPFM